MTDKEKAWAYDEALKRAKAAIDMAADKDLVGGVVRTILPELRESEDERMRKMLIDRVRSAEELTDELREWILTYLEKQKEQKPLIKKGVKYYCIKAQKRCTDFYTYAFTVGTEYIAPENNVLVDNDGHSWDLTRQTPEWIFERFTPKEQKPAEWSEEDDALLKEIVSFFKDGTVKLQHDLDLYAGFLENKFKSLRPQPNLEWNKEEKTIIDCAVDVVEEAEEYTSKVDCGEYGVAVTEAYIAGVLSERNRKPAEWSEEDEKKITFLERLIRYNVPEGQYGWADGHRGGFVTKLEAISMLKSLRPQPREEIYQSAKHDLAIRFMNYLDENRPEGKMGLSNGECEDIDKAFMENDWAKIMRYVEKYRPSWKPSEEQMEALKNCVDGWEDNADGRLESLYNDLKKLI